jgi:hypothetical protein
MCNTRYAKLVVGLGLAAAAVAIAATGVPGAFDPPVRLTERLAAPLDAVGRRFPVLERLYTRWLPPTVSLPPVAAAVSGGRAPGPSGAPAPTAPALQDLDALSPAEREALTALASRVRGRLVWSSNRFGNHELVLVDLPELKIRRLTDDPHVDFFSRFSPDGTRISFVRSRREWVSFREESAWDLYVVNVDGTGERRLAEHAYFPMWTPDGSALTFQRDNTLWRLDLATGREQPFHDGSSEPTDGTIGEASFQQDGLLALNWRRRGRQRVGVLDGDRTTFIALSTPHACQIAWHPDGKGFLWVQGHSGNGGNRIMSMRLEDGAEEVLIDLPGQYSHEYFPRLSTDGEWLVWAAAAEGHEHDRADYELFGWKLGTAWESAIRLTYAGANDQGPDLYVR